MGAECRYRKKIVSLFLIFLAMWQGQGVTQCNDQWMLSPSLMLQPVALRGVFEIDNDQIQQCTSQEYALLRLVVEVLAKIKPIRIKGFTVLGWNKAQRMKKVIVHKLQEMDKKKLLYKAYPRYKEKILSYVKVFPETDNPLPIIVFDCKPVELFSPLVDTLSTEQERENLIEVLSCAHRKIQEGVLLHEVNTYLLNFIRTHPSLYNPHTVAFFEKMNGEYKEGLMWWFEYLLETVFHEGYGVRYGEDSYEAHVRVKVRIQRSFFGPKQLYDLIAVTRLFACYGKSYNREEIPFLLQYLLDQTMRQYPCRDVDSSA